MKSTFLPALINRVNGSSGGNCIAEVDLGSVDLLMIMVYILMTNCKGIAYLRFIPKKVVLEPKSKSETLLPLATLHWISWSFLFSEYWSAHVK